VIEPEKDKKLRIFCKFLLTRLEQGAPGKMHLSLNSTNITHNFGYSFLFFLFLCVELQQCEVTIFGVKNGQILTFRILTHGVEAALASCTHRSSTHATTLTGMVSISFTPVAHEPCERSKFQSQSRIFIVSTNSCNSPIDHECMHRVTHSLHT
jgi:hypothetical protein